MVELDNRSAGPQLVPDLISGHYLARALDEHAQNLGRLPPQTHANAAIAQLAGPQIQFEACEAGHLIHMPGPD